MPDINKVISSRPFASDDRVTVWIPTSPSSKDMLDGPTTAVASGFVVISDIDERQSFEHVIQLVTSGVTVNGPTVGVEFKDKGTLWLEIENQDSVNFLQDFVIEVRPTSDADFHPYLDGDDLSDSTNSNARFQGVNVIKNLGPGLLGVTRVRIASVDAVRFVPSANGPLDLRVKGSFTEPEG